MPSIPILNLFGQSPIRPLEKHMAEVHACTMELIPFFEASFEGDWKKVEAARKNIVEMENKADDMKRDLRLHLPRGLLMPVARTDLLELLGRQDYLANKAKDITGLVFGRRLQVPPSLQSVYIKFLKRCLDGVTQANIAIHELDGLLEAGFSGKEKRVVEGMIRELHRIEHDADKLEIESRQGIFEIEASLPPVDVVFLYKLMDWTGDLADYSQHIGDRLLILITR